MYGETLKLTPSIVSCILLS